jgi:hypothetical protein
VPTFLTWIGEAVFSLMTGLSTAYAMVFKILHPVP